MLRKIGLAVLLCGFVLFIFGAIQVKTYQEEKFDSNKSPPGMLGGRDDFSNYLEVQERNRRGAWEAEYSWQQAQPYIFSGVAIGVGGVVLMVTGSFRKKAKE